MFQRFRKKNEVTTPKATTNKASTPIKTKTSQNTKTIKLEFISDANEEDVAKMHETVTKALDAKKEELDKKIIYTIKLNQEKRKKDDENSNARSTVTVHVDAVLNSLTINKNTINIFNSASWALSLIQVTDKAISAIKSHSQAITTSSHLLNLRSVALEHLVALGKKLVELENIVYGSNPTDKIETFSKLGSEIRKIFVLFDNANKQLKAEQASLIQECQPLLILKKELDAINYERSRIQQPATSEGFIYEAWETLDRELQDDISCISELEKTFKEELVSPSHDIDHTATNYKARILLATSKFGEAVKKQAEKSSAPTESKEAEGKDKNATNIHRLHTPAPSTSTKAAHDSVKARDSSPPRSGFSH